MGGNGDGTATATVIGGGGLHDAAVDAQVIGNTVVDSARPGLHVGCTFGISVYDDCRPTSEIASIRPYIPDGTTVAENLIVMQASTAAPVDFQRGRDTGWRDNIVHSAAGTTGFVTTGITVTDPSLARSGGLLLPQQVTAGASGLVPLEKSQTGPDAADPACP